MKFKVMTAVLFSLFAFAKAQSQNKLTLKLTGIESNEGTIYFSLFNNEKGFPEEGTKSFKTAIVNEFDDTATVTFDVPDGNYAVTYYQDEDNNKELKKNFLGIPREPVGASNMDSLGKPKFDKCKFKVTGDRLIKLVFMN